MDQPHTALYRDSRPGAIRLATSSPAELQRFDLSGRNRAATRHATDCQRDVTALTMVVRISQHLSRAVDATEGLARQGPHAVAETDRRHLS